MGKGNVKWGEGRGNVRSLSVFTPAPHNHISGTGLRLSSLLIALLTLGCLFEESHRCAGHPAHISPCVCANNAQQTLSSFFGQVGFLEHALRAVDVGQVECGAGMARVEDGCEAHTGLEGLHQDAVHFVVDYVAYLAEIDRVDDFVVAVIFVAVEIFGLATMS